jgi:hypothetical protein
MSTTLLDRTAHALRGNRTRAAVGLGVVFILVAAAAGVLLLTRVDAAPPPAEALAPAPVRLEQVHGLPPGATDCPPVYSHLLTPYARGARGTPQTSCGFVEQVRMAYAKQPPATGARQMRVPSPTTYKWYDLVCTPTPTPIKSYVTCSGGAAAIMYLYNDPG